MGIDLRRARVGAFWIDAATPDLRTALERHVPDLVSLGQTDWRSNPRVQTIPIPVLGFLEIRHHKPCPALRLVSHVGNRFRIGELPEAADAMRRLGAAGVRWQECRFLTDAGARDGGGLLAYRLRAWARGEEPVIERIFWSVSEKGDEW